VDSAGTHDHAREYPLSQFINGRRSPMDLLMGSSTNSGFDSRGYEYQLPHSVSPITGPSPRAHSVHVESSLLQTQVRPQESMTTEGSRYRDIAVKRRLGVRTLSIFIVGDEAVGDADTPAPLLDKSVKWKRDTIHGPSVHGPFSNLPWHFFIS